MPLAAGELRVKLGPIRETVVLDHWGNVMFTCPRCKRGLHAVATKTFRYHLCRHCGGRAIPWVFIREHYDRHLVNRLWSEATAPNSPQGLPCPCCGRAARRVFKKTYEKTTELDLCPRCRLLWCDQGELEELGTPTLAPVTPEQLSGKVREMIAEFEAFHKAKRQETVESWRAGELFNAGGDALPDEVWKWPFLYLGFPVETEDPGLTRFPWGTYAIAALCVLVAVLTWNADFPAIVGLFGFVPAVLWTNPLYSLMTMISSFFLHANLFHLLANMWFLLSLGDNTEDDLGTRNFLLLLLAAAVVGDLAHAFADPRSEIPAIGASGGVSAVVAYYMLRFPFAQISIFFLPALRPVAIPAWSWAFFWVIGQLALALLQLKGETDIAAFAHLGGFLVGVIAWSWVTYKSRLLRRAA